MFIVKYKSYELFCFQQTAYLCGLFYSYILFFYRRQVKKTKSVIHLLLFNEEAEDDVKCKNIKQTEILVDLREAILQVKHLKSDKPPFAYIFFR